MFLIFILYGLLLFGIGSLVYPEYNPVVALDYPLNTTYNEEINPYVFIRGTATLEKDEDDKEEMVNSTQMFVYIRALNGVNIPNVTYSYSALDKGGVMRYFIESSRSGAKVPVTHTSSKRISPTGNDLEKLFIKVKYKLIASDESEVTKELRFSENIINITEKDLSKFSLGSVLSEKASVKFEFRDKSLTDPQYETNFQITLADKTKPYKINFQSWLVTEDNDIYPYVGLYNYSYTDNFKPSYYTYVNKYVEPEWIYSKLEYTDMITKEVHILLYKVSVEQLLSEGN